MPRRLRPLVLCLGLTVFGLSRPSAQRPEAPAAQAQDPDFAARVKEWTTRPEFLTPLVDHLPIVPGVPTPKDVLGYHVGVPGKLTSTGEALRYYRALEAKSARVKVVTIGKTDEGRDLTIVVVADEATIRDLERYRGYLAQLADPRSLSDAQARTIIASAKPIYHLMGGLHSGETGPPEMLMELAYRLAVGESPLIRQIRGGVIVTILPAADPDGRDRYVDWYRQHLVGITGERDRVAGPPYWGRYVFHDINRDINYSQASTRALLEWYLRWHPPVMHDLHESVPFLYTFSGQAPQNPSLDPILYGELPMFANFEMAQLTKYGLPGVWTHGFVDMWSPGYLAFMASNHNGLTRMYETFGNAGATTMTRTLTAQDGAAAPGAPPAPNRTTREWYRPSPPYKEVEWSMRNNTNFMETGVLTALELASAFPKVLLENFYLKSRRAIEAGQKEPPYGFVIPAGQADPTRVARLVNLLRIQGIEVGRATGALALSDGKWPAGSYVVKRDQPYGRLAKILLHKEDYPDPALRTYDDTGWVMGLMLHVEVKATVDRAVLSAAVEPVARVEPAGGLSGPPGAAIVVANHGANALATLRYRVKDVKVRAADTAFTVAQSSYPAGSLVIDTNQAGHDVRALVGEAVRSLGLSAVSLAAMPDVQAHDVDLPRLAMYSTWGNTQEVGWVRHAFDQFEVPYELIYKERARRGGLRADYDVILIPSQGPTAKRLVYDIDMRGAPLPYAISPAFPSLGAYGESDDIRGGMGLEGVLELQRFLEAGGTIVTLGASSAFPADFGLIRTVTAARPTAQFYAPGPIVQAEIVKPTHPIFYGYASPRIPVRYANGPLLQVPERDRDTQVLARFVGGDDSVLNGLMRGAGEISNQPAVVEAPAGRGRLVLFATNPCYRWQNHGEFGMLFNTVLHWNDRPTVPPQPTAAPVSTPAQGR
jgi:Zinc carboxypeptidase